MRLVSNHQLSIGFAALCLIAAPRSFSHGLDLPQPSAAELAQIQSPLTGSTNFARTLFQHLRNRLDAGQTDLLDNIGQTSVKYVRCIKPNAAKSPDTFHRPMVVEQLRSAGMIEAIKVTPR